MLGKRTREPQKEDEELNKSSRVEEKPTWLGKRGVRPFEFPEMSKKSRLQQSVYDIERYRQEQAERYRRELDRRELDRRELDRRELDRRELDRRETSSSSSSSSPYKWSELLATVYKPFT